MSRKGWLADKKREDPLAIQKSRNRPMPIALQLTEEKAPTSILFQILSKKIGNA